MLFTGPQRILLICLLHFCTCSLDEDVDPTVLMNIVNNIENQLRDQYAIAFRVEKSKCRRDSGYSGGDLNIRGVREKFNKTNEVYVSENLIAAKPDKNIQDHSEFRLKNYLKNILNKTDQCVIYFTVNSPCLDKCISNSGDVSIKMNLQDLGNYEGMRAFAFKIVWIKDKDKIQDVIKRLKEIAPGLPYYQCEKRKTSCNRL